MRGVVRWVGRATVTAVIAVAVGCAGDAPDAFVATVTDSAGVRIVTHDLTGVTVPTYRTVSEHDLEIGVQEGAPEYSFSRIPDLAIAPDGSIVVSDALAQELRVFDANGAFLRAIGQAGDGHGEFANAPVLVGFAGDTVFAFDVRSSRISSFTMRGDLISMMTLRAGDPGRPVFMIRQDDGTYLTQAPWLNRVLDSSFHDARLE
jgi:hypothetical protein